MKKLILMLSLSVVFLTGTSQDLRSGNSQLTNSQTTSHQSSRQEATSTAVTDAIPKAVAIADDDKPGFTFAGSIEYGFLPKGESDTYNYAYAITVGANYYFMHNYRGVFAGARIGYNSASYHSMMKFDRSSYLTTKSESHFITIPIVAGYAFTTADRNWGVTPYLGFDINCCVAGKYKTEGTGKIKDFNNEMKYPKKVGIDFRLGGMVRLYGFDLGVSYVIPVNDNQKGYFGEDSYVAVNIAFGF